MSATSLTSTSSKETAKIAQRIAEAVQPGDAIALSGEVGAGKTTFAQGFIGALLTTPQIVTSPTFTLTQMYDTKHFWPVVHADLYRLKHASGLGEIGLEEAFDKAVTLIEWPEIAEPILPQTTLYVNMEHVNQDARKITLYSTAERWQNWLKQQHW